MNYKDTKETAEKSFRWFGTAPCLQLAPSKAPEAALVAWSFEWGSPQGGPREEE